jgi:DNA mismatch repair protein MLH3
VGQVDKKFVACLIEDGATVAKTLVLVDQHAADERIRVERFLSELCQGFLDHGLSGGVETRELQPAIPVLLTRLEARALAGSDAYRLAFASWGFRFAPMPDPVAVEEDGPGDEYLQVFVQAIPDIVSDKVFLHVLLPCEAC